MVVSWPVSLRCWQPHGLGVECGCTERAWTVHGHGMADMPMRGTPFTMCGTESREAVHAWHMAVLMIFRTKAPAIGPHTENRFTVCVLNIPSQRHRPGSQRSVQDAGTSGQPKSELQRGWVGGGDAKSTNQEQHHSFCPFPTPPSRSATLKHSSHHPLQGPCPGLNELGVLPTYCTRPAAVQPLPRPAAVRGPPSKQSLAGAPARTMVAMGDRKKARAVAVQGRT